MATDPDQATSLEILTGLPGAGVDVIELGVPFSDAMADGPAIQEAASRALAAGGGLRKTLELAANFRRQNQTTPTVLMGYTNPIFNFGYKRLAREAAEAGVDGFIVVDLPPEEATELRDELDRHNISLIRLSTPTTDSARMEIIAERASGFIYHVSVAGVTGVGEADEATAAPSVEALKSVTGLPIAVGFGVRTPERAAAIARIADAVVVGSVLVEEVATAVVNNEPPQDRVMVKVKSLARAVRSARVTRQS
ncbi:hypothetical protein N185_32265 [Sinorhizobium sp. GW3]|nr:hypothetical protein N185_32265 [Sinorhizobium sp. GW3]